MAAADADVDCCWETEGEGAVEEDAVAALLAAAPQAAHGPSHERPPADERVQRIRLDDDPDPA